FIEPEVPATDEGIKAIEAAQWIILGPGSFLTSIMPPLLLPEIGKAIAANTQAKVIFIDNLSHEFGPAGEMALEQRLQWCERATNGRPIDILVTTSQVSKDIQQSYQIHQANLASPNYEWRHDRDKLKACIESIIEHASS
ncbi:MAG: gluconeogenesis factor YvcK family protein, partial [Vibrio sp.]